MGTISGGTYTRLEFSIPARGLIGYRGEFMTDTKGNGILNTVFDGYGEYKGDIQYRKQGSPIAFESGEAITYGLYNAQERGTLFIGPGEKVYSGMVIGQCAKAEDIELNVCKCKTVYLLQIRKIFLVLRRCYGHKFPCSLITLDFFRKHEVIYFTATAKRFGKHDFLFRCWIKSVFNRTVHN